MTSKAREQLPPPSPHPEAQTQLPHPSPMSPEPPGFQEGSRPGGPHHSLANPHRHPPFWQDVPGASSQTGRFSMESTSRSP